MEDLNSMKFDFDVCTISQKALEEIKTVFSKISPVTAEDICTGILKANRIACYGVGREGLMMKALCMRLMHLGLDAHVIGDMTTPPIGNGDLLIASAGPGTFSTVLGLLGVSKGAGADTMLITAQPDSPASRLADSIIHLPAQTMADDLGISAGILPMGSLFEAVQLLFFDLVAIMLRELTGQTSEQMRRRHTNLE